MSASSRTTFRTSGTGPATGRSATCATSARTPVATGSLRRSPTTCDMFCTKLRQAIRAGARAAAKTLIQRLNLDERTPLPTWTLADTVDWMVPMALAGKDVRCPCCDQNVHVYYRHLNGPMARTLIHMYCYDCAHPGEWMHVDNYL